MSDLKCPKADERIEHSEVRRFGRGVRTGLWCPYKKWFCEDGSGCVDYDEKFTMVEPNEVCVNTSPYGNYCIKLTDADIEAIKQGKVGAILDEEYNIFVKYVGGEVDG